MKPSQMTPDWVFQPLWCCGASTLGGGAIWYFLSQRSLHATVWTGFAFVVVVALAVTLHRRNDLLRGEQQPPGGSPPGTKTCRTKRGAPVSSFAAEISYQGLDGLHCCCGRLAGCCRRYRLPLATRGKTPPAACPAPERPALANPPAEVTPSDTGRPGASKTDRQEKSPAEKGTLTPDLPSCVHGTGFGARRLSPDLTSDRATLAPTPERPISREVGCGNTRQSEGNHAILPVS